MIYTFRFISNEEENFVLDVNINHDQTFEDLHLAIQKTLEYDSSQMASFFTSNNKRVFMSKSMSNGVLTGNYVRRTFCRDGWLSS